MYIVTTLVMKVIRYKIKKVGEVTSSLGALLAEL